MGWTHVTSSQIFDKKFAFVTQVGGSHVHGRLDGRPETETLFSGYSCGMVGNGEKQVKKNIPRRSTFPKFWVGLAASKR